MIGVPSRREGRPYVGQSVATPCWNSASILVLGPSLGGSWLSLAGSWDRFTCFADREPERVKSRRDTPRRLTLLFHARIPFWLKLLPEPATPRPSYSLFSCLAAATDTPAFDARAALSSEHRCLTRRLAQIVSFEYGTENGDPDGRDPSTGPRSTEDSRFGG